MAWSKKPLSRSEVESLTNVWRARGLIPVLVAVASAFAAWALLLPVVPTAVIDAGEPASLAGLSTGVFMLATVITQIFTPKALKTFGFGWVLAASSLLLGIPAFGYMLGMDAVPLLTVSAIRGVGFGALSVAEAAIIAELVPLRLLGSATGIIIMTGFGVTLLTILGIGPDLPSEFGQDALRPLSLHGIEAELALRPAGAGGIGATILQACDDLGAGLLIMGAYEHSKFSEDLLGGTTKDILARAPLPVLMAH